MSELARRVNNENIPEWAEGLYYASGPITEALYFEHKGEDSGRVRFNFELLQALKMVEEENGNSPSTHLGE